MLIVLSPAKSLDYQTPRPTETHSTAEFLNDAAELIAALKPLPAEEISSLMGISEKLGVLNHGRYHSWSLPFTEPRARQSILAFKGDVYQGLDAYSFSEEDFDYAQVHLRILSGLYGLLRPLDLILPYRLEMGTKFSNARGSNLYRFWGNRITAGLNRQLDSMDGNTLVNLASNEYFKSIQTTALGANVITPVFKDWKNGKFKIISFFAKKARGRMSAYAIKHRLSSPEDLKAYDWDDYSYNDDMSSKSDWVFTRSR